jgi:hypothetical protein
MRQQIADDVNVVRNFGLRMKYRFVISVERNLK